MSTLTPETFRFLVDQIVTRRFFLTSEEGSSLRREDRKTYNEYFSVYYNIFPSTTTSNFPNFCRFYSFKAIDSTQTAPLREDYFND